MKQMLLLALAALILFGCTKKDNGTPTVSNPSKLIIGLWKPTADTLTIIQNGTAKDIDSSDGSNVPTELFNADGTGFAGYEPYTYTIKDNIITFKHAAYTEGGVDVPAYSQKATIKQLTATKLVIFYDDTSVFNGITERDTEVEYLTKSL